MCSHLFRLPNSLDIAAANGAIFFEASNAPNQIDHNIIYNVEGGSGIYQRDCNRLLIAHNLIQNCSAAGVRMRKTQHRDRVGVCKNNRVVNNIIASCPMAFDYEVMENISNYNLLSNIGEDFSLSEWQTTGLDTDSRMAKLDLAMDPRDQCLTWSSQADAVLRVHRDEYQSLDYFGRSYPGVEIPVGPFTEGWSSVCRRLRLTPNS